MCPTVVRSLFRLRNVGAAAAAAVAVLVLSCTVSTADGRGRTGRKLTCTVTANGTSTEFECFRPAQCCPTGCCMLHGAKPFRHTRWFIWIVLLLLLLCIICILLCYIAYRKLYQRGDQVHRVTTTAVPAPLSRDSDILAGRARPPDYHTCMSAEHREQQQPPNVVVASSRPVEANNEPPPLYEESAQHECIGGMPGAKRKCRCSAQKLARLNQSL